MKISHKFLLDHSFILEEEYPGVYKTYIWNIGKYRIKKRTDVSYYEDFLSHRITNTLDLMYGISKHFEKMGKEDCQNKIKDAIGFLMTK